MDGSRINAERTIGIYSCAGAGSARVKKSCFLKQLRGYVDPRNFVNQSSMVMNDI
jgi:hypothetical protein